MADGDGRRRYDEVAVGERIEAREFAVDRAQLVRYAGASLDFNPIHWSDAAAERAGLPDVIAHGMLTMAIAGRLVTDWAGDPGSVRDYSVRFSGIVPVPAEGTTTVRASGVIAEKLADGRVVVELLVESGERQVLKRARAVVDLIF